MNLIRRIATFLSALAVSVSAFAQEGTPKQPEPKVSPGSTAIDVTVKRAVAQGNDVFVDLMVTSRSSWKVLAFLSDHCVIYDDEGNLYRGGLVNMEYRVLFEVDGSRHNQCHLEMERGIPRKVRIIIRNVDEYAASFPLIKLRYYGDNTCSNDNTITIENLFIKRED